MQITSSSWSPSPTRKGGARTRTKLVDKAYPGVTDEVAIQELQAERDRLNKKHELLEAEASIATGGGRWNISCGAFTNSRMNWTNLSFALFTIHVQGTLLYMTYG